MFIYFKKTVKITGGFKKTTEFTQKMGIRVLLYFLGSNTVFLCRGQWFFRP
jgi:hypothetical protein